MTTTIAVVGGKGGVGKTTMSVNLAVELARRGRAVGLVDGDIGGPDVMRLLGVTRRTKARSIDLWNAKGRTRVAPLEGHGVQFVSPQMMLGEDQPILMSGNFLDLFLTQLLEPAWDPTPEVVVIDSSPGTGEVAQKLLGAGRPHGVVMVSTGGPLSVLDNRKMASLLTQLDIRTWAVVENLQSMRCPNCGTDVKLGGTDATGWEPERGVGPPIARIEVALDIDARRAEDEGVPAVLSSGADRFRAAITQLADHIETTIAR